MLREIENGVPTGPVLNTPPKSVGNVGCPTEQMCVDSGLYCFCVYPEGYDPETQDLENPTYDPQTKTCTYDAVDASAARLASLIAAKKQEIAAAYTAADDAILGGYTRQQKERFYKRDAQGCACHLDPDHPDSTYIDALTEGWEPDPAKRPAKKTELCQRAHDLSASIQAAAGLIDGKYERLMTEIDTINLEGDYATEKAKLEAISW